MGKIGDVGVIVLLSIGTIFVFIYIVLIIKGKKHRFMIETLGSDHPLKELYLFGLSVLELVNYKYNTKYDRKMMKQIRIVQGKNFEQYYYRIHLAQKIAYATLSIIITCLLSALLNELLILVFGLFATVGIVYYVTTTVTDHIKERKESIMSDFSEVLSKLALLVNAGMILGEAWEKVASTGKGVIYKEMKNTVEEIENGTSDVDAYLEFAARCDVTEVSKFASTLAQSLSKGNSELSIFLKQFSKESWNERKHYAKRKGEEASGKLLIPIALMFLGVLLMIVVPIMSGLSF